MRRPVLPEPAGASTIQDCRMSSAWLRASQSGGADAGGGAGGASSRGGSARSRRLSKREGWSESLGTLAPVLLAGFVVDMLEEGAGVEPAERALRAVLAGGGEAFGEHARVSGVEARGEVFQRFAPLGLLDVEACGGRFFAFEQDAVASLKPGVAHLFAGTDGGEGDGIEGAGLGKHGVEGKLRRVGAGAEPLAGFGAACLVVDQDNAVPGGAIEAVHTNVEPQRTDDELAVLLALENLEGSALQFLVEPGGQDGVKTDVLNVEIRGVPGCFGDCEPAFQSIGDVAVERGSAFRRGHGAESVLGFDFGPEVLENMMHDISARPCVEAEGGLFERLRGEPVEGEGAESAGGLRFQDACSAAEGGIRKRAEWEAVVDGLERRWLLGDR